MTNHHEETLHEHVEEGVDTSSALELNKVGRAFKNYFGNIYEALSTVVAGLRITVPTFFTKPYTVQYPDVNMLDPWDENDPRPLSHQVSERYRGFLVNDIDTCNGCGHCKNTCPVNAIIMEAGRFPEKKGLVLQQYDIDYALCIYCGLCVEVCPTDSLVFSREFDRPVDDLALLYKEFVSEEDKKRMYEKAPTKPPKAPKAPKPAPKKEGDTAKAKTPAKT